MKNSPILTALPQVLEISKREIAPLVKRLAKETQEPADAYTKIKRLNEFCSLALKALSPAVLDGMEEGKSEVNGMELSAQTRNRFSYNHSAAYQDLKNELAIAEEKAKMEIDPIKARLANLEKLMQKKAENILSDILTADGEMVEPAIVVNDPTFFIKAKF